MKTTDGASPLCPLRPGVWKLKLGIVGLRPEVLCFAQALDGSRGHVGTEGPIPRGPFSRSGWRWCWWPHVEKHLALRMSKDDERWVCGSVGLAADYTMWRLSISSQPTKIGKENGVLHPWVLQSIHPVSFKGCTFFAEVWDKAEKGKWLWLYVAHQKRCGSMK